MRESQKCRLSHTFAAPPIHMALTIPIQAPMRTNQCVLSYPRDSQVLGPCDPRQVSLCGEDFPDAQLMKDVLQAVVSGDGELGQGEFDHPENGERNVRVTELCVLLKPHCSQSSCTHSPLTGKNSLYIRAYMT